MVNRQFGVKNCYSWFLGYPYVQFTWYCACAVNIVAFAMGKRYYSPITWLNLRRSALKVTKWIDKLRSCISKMWIIFVPRCRSRDTAHAQFPFQVKVMWSGWVTHNSGTDNCSQYRFEPPPKKKKIASKVFIIFSAGNAEFQKKCP